MKSVCLAIAVQAVATDAILVGMKSESNQSGCQAQDFGRRALIQGKLAAFGADCESMCRRMGIYPNCQCPGFKGNPASDGDTRACMTKYCQDPSTPCPTDAFVACVKGNTEVSLMQWGSLLQRFDASLSFVSKAPMRTITGTSFLTQGSCIAQDRSHRALIQAKLATFGVDCENMCKRMGIYPKCQCPGFEGNPASDGDTRACMDKYCQDPSTPCPTDAFVTCVRENTKVSLLQWGTLFSRFDSYARLWNKTMLSNATQAKRS